MSAQLDQVLAYLDRPGVSEIVISAGRPIAIKQGAAFANLTAKPVTAEQIIQLVQGTPIATLIPQGDGTRAPTEVDVGARRVKAHVGRRGGDLVIRLERGVGGPGSIGEATTARAPVAQPAPRAKTPTSSGGRAKTPTSSGGRAKTPTSSGGRAKRQSSIPLDLAGPPSGGGGRSKRPSSIPLELGPAMVDAADPHAGLIAAAVAAVAPRSRRASLAGDPSRLAKLVRIARDRGASDLHVASMRVISMRVGGELVPVEAGEPPITLASTEAMLMPLLSAAQQVALQKVGYVDLAVDAPGGGRLRTNITRHQNGIKATFRLAMAEPATLEQLNLPAELAKVVAHHQGFVVIAGPSGHGKTTTLAALVDLINSVKPFHILTVEDPIEIVHPRKSAVVSQREAGLHTKSFATALKASLREDPDVIVIGELRDRETVEIALTASETGHLVLATMSTPSAAKTLDRLIDMFPPEDHSQVRASIAGALRAIVAQRLLPAKSGTGVVPAVELVTGVLPLAALIRDDKLYQLPNLMQRGKAFGMIRFDDSLAELVRAGKITEEAAMMVAENKKDFAKPQVTPPGGAGAGSNAATQPIPKSRLGGLFGRKDND